MSPMSGFVRMSDAFSSVLNVLDAHLSQIAQLAHLEEAAVDVARAVARLAVARELDGALVVDAERRGRVRRQAGHASGGGWLLIGSESTHC